MDRPYTLLKKTNSSTTRDPLLGRPYFSPMSPFPHGWEGSYFPGTAVFFPARLSGSSAPPTSHARFGFAPSVRKIAGRSPESSADLSFVLPFAADGAQDPSSPSNPIHAMAVSVFRTGSILSDRARQHLVKLIRAHLAQSNQATP